MHSKKVAHKDFKSLNVLMDANVLKISDFGESKEETGCHKTSNTESPDPNPRDSNPKPWPLLETLPKLLNSKFSFLKREP
jgi:serine/threonine protein kinase